MKSVPRPGAAVPLRRRDGRRHRAASAPALDRAREPLVAPHAKQFGDRAAWRNPGSEDVFQRASQSAQLWLACRFVDLPVDALYNTGLNLLTPVVVHDGHQRHPVVIGCNEAARRQGLQPGMRLGVAHTLVAGLQARARDSELEHRALVSLATRAMQFSSRVIIEAPDTLLLEIGASVRLFHSLEALLRRFTQSFERQHSENDDYFDTANDTTGAAYGYRLSLAVSPVAAASRLLCVRDEQRCIITSDQLNSALASVPLGDLPLSQRVFKTLRGMGLARLGDVMRLPRDGLARRVGPDVVALIDRLSGRLADAHDYFMPADYFRSGITLTDDIINIDQLMIIAKRLIDELSALLNARGCGVDQLNWQFDHHDRSTTRLTLNLTKPHYEAAHFLELMHTRTENMVLPGPIHTVTLHSSRFESLTLQPMGLFPEIEQTTPQFDLIDRLRARLGDSRITSLDTCEEHTPEKAWRTAVPNTIQNSKRRETTHKPDEPTTLPRRPLWLLEKPRRLRCTDGAPWLHGPLALIDGPERIETGWWEQNIRRDYYVALSSRGRHYWVFYDIRMDGWFMQGTFL